MAASEGDRPGPTAGDDAVLESLVARCLEEMQRGHGGDPLETLCEEHPDLAGPLRARMQKLRELGIVTLADGGAGGAAEDAVAEAITGYEIVAPLGTGGMGEVWLARQTVPVRRDVALKVIKRGMDTAQIVRRFESERQALAMLEHEGIAKVFDAGSTASGRPYFAMEYVDGVPITDYCDDHELSTEARLELFARVCDAVWHAHQRGIIHRDLKPSNVLVRSNGDAVPKVIDFGLAKATEPHLAEQTLFTQLGQVVGTPEYMSPEQAGAGDGEVDTRTDVYSLGAVLYELLVGDMPFETEQLRSRGLSKLQEAIREQEAVRPSTKISDLADRGDEIAHRRGAANRGALSRRLAGDLDWIAMKALEKDRDRRYASVAELAEDVRRHLRHEPVLAGPPTLGYRLSKFIRRYRGPVSAAAALLVVGVAGLVLFTREYLRAERTLTEFDLLAAVDLPDQYAAEARDELWPALPVGVPAMDSWLVKARALVEDLPTREQTLQELREQYGTPGPSGRPDDWTFEQNRYQLLHDELRRMTHGLAALAADGGLIEQVEARRVWASSLEERTIIAQSEAWERAAREIADPETCPPYEGRLQLTPQLGLIPLGADPQSKLYEFALAQPGSTPPRRDRNGHLVYKADSDMVLVLLPAAAALIGASFDEGEPNYDPWAVGAEGPPRIAELDAFFISKFEVTQAQWERLTGENPSLYTAEIADLPLAEIHPVERVSWTDCDTWLSRIGLELPTEAQWEYAARAGTTTVWWCGSEVADLYRPPGRPGANLADKTCQELGGVNMDAYDSQDDGYRFHAPADACRPNAFGLHHTIGNVWEWCRDPVPAYAATTPRPGDGYQAGPDMGNRTWRGGSFLSIGLRARCAIRVLRALNDRPAVVGVRPVRRLDP